MITQNTFNFHGMNPLTGSGCCLGGAYPHPIYQYPTSACVVLDPSQIPDASEMWDRLNVPAEPECPCNPSTLTLDDATGEIVFVSNTGEETRIPAGGTAGFDPADLTDDQVNALAEALANAGNQLTDLFGVDLGDILP